MYDRPGKFEYLKDKYGRYSSWAVWAEEGKRPKENMGDLSVFDLEANPGLLQQLKPDIVLVGLNVSRGSIETPLGNFHDPRPEAMDFKIRYALRESPFWVAYMTDIIKNFDQKASGKVMSFLRKNPAFEQENVEFFRQELIDLGAPNPTLIAFGSVTYSILTRNFWADYRIVRIPHYSDYCSKERYREEVMKILQC